VQSVRGESEYLQHDRQGQASHCGGYAQQLQQQFAEQLEGAGMVGEAAL